MAKNIRMMTEGKPTKLIFTFALPLMLGNVFQQLYTVVDTMVVGKVLGINALAALGAADWINWMVLGIIQGFAQGFSILMAQEFGAKKIDRLKKVVGNSIGLAAVSAVLLLVISQLTVLPILRVLQTPDSVINQSLLYLRIMFMGIPVVMAYNLFASILRALGDGDTITCNVRGGIHKYCSGPAFCGGIWMGNWWSCGSYYYCSVFFQCILFYIYS